MKNRYLSNPDAKVAEISSAIKKTNSKEALSYEEEQRANIRHISSLHSYGIIDSEQFKILRTCFAFTNINWCINTYWYINFEGRLIMETF